MFSILCARILVYESKTLFPKIFNRDYVQYVQGQSPLPGIREYFYYINHEGMLFLDDTRLKNFTSCFKDVSFLRRFFKNLDVNSTKRYVEDFPYVSRCGKELNFVRCDDTPFVFTKIVERPDLETGQTMDFIVYGHAGDSLKTNYI